MSLLATRFKNRRLELKMSQSEVADGICKQGRISRIEQGNYSPGSELLHKLAKKLNVSLDYFFDENIVDVSSNLSTFREISKKMLNQRDYEGLKYIYELEKIKTQKLTVSDQLYLSWIEVMIIFHVEKKRKEAINKIERLLEQISKKDLLYLLFSNTLLNFYTDNNDYSSYENKYEEIFLELETIQLKSLEEVELYIKLKYNYCRYLWLNDKGEEAVHEILEVIKNHL